MPGNVLADEARDEVIAVVVPCLHAKRQLHAVLAASTRQIFRLQLFRQKSIRGTLVNQYRSRISPGADQASCVPFTPGVSILA